MRIAAQAFGAESKPDHRSDDLDHRLWHVQHLLRQAAQREYTAWALSSALEIVADQHFWTSRRRSSKSSRPKRASN